MFFERREAVREQFATDCFYHYIQKRNILEQWADIKRSLTGEHGVWSTESDFPEQITFQVDPTENFTRMRMRLIPDHTSGRHEEASRLRDEGYRDSTAMSSTPIEHALLLEARVVRHTTSVSSEASEFSFIIPDEETLLPTKK